MAHLPHFLFNRRFCLIPWAVLQVFLMRSDARAHGGISSVSALRDLFVLFLALPALLFLLIAFGLKRHNTAKRLYSRCCIAIPALYTLLCGFLAVEAGLESPAISDIFLWIFVVVFFLIALLLYFIDHKALRNTLVMSVAGSFIMLSVLTPGVVSFRFLSIYDNDPREAGAEAIKPYSSHHVARADGTVVYFERRLGIGSLTVTPQMPARFEELESESRDPRKKFKVSIFYQPRYLSQQSALDRYVIRIPVVPIFYPKYTSFEAVGQVLQEPWQADGPMLIDATGTGGYPEWVKQLLEHGADLNYQEAFLQRTPLVHALVSGQTESAEMLIKAGADVNIRDEYGAIALHYSAQIRDVEVLQTLVQNSENLNLINKWGNAPLHTALGNLALVQLLVAYGADLTLRDDHNQTPLEAARKRLSYQSDPARIKEFEQIIQFLEDSSPARSSRP